MDTDTLLTVFDVAEVLRVPVGTIRYLVRTKELPTIVLPGGHTLIERSALAKFLEDHRRPHTEEVAAEHALNGDDGAATQERGGGT